MQVKRTELKAALAAAGKIVRSRPGIPALSGVRLEHHGRALELLRFDLEASYRVSLEAVEVDGEGWAALVPAKLLAAAVKGGGDLVSLELEGDALKVGAGSIRCVDLEDFPTLPDAGAVFADLEADVLAGWLGAVLPAASRDEARLVLTGVLLEHDGRTLTAVATDSYRLHVSKLGTGTVGKDARLIVPGSFLRAVASILGRKPAGRVPMHYDGASTAGVELPGGAVATSRIIDGEYPNWRQLVPDAGDEGVTMAVPVTAELVAALEAAVPFCGDNAPARFVFGFGFVEISARSADLGSFVQRVELETRGADVVVAFNPGYLGDALKLGGVLELRDGLHPCIIRASSGAVALVMPVRLPAVEPAAVVAPVKAAAPTVTARVTRGPVAAIVAARDRAATDYGAPEPVAHPDPYDEPEPAVPTMRAAAYRDPPPAIAPAASSEPWAELAEVVRVGAIRVRVVVGPDGEPWVDCRRFASSRRYSGPTRKGLAVDRSTALALAVAYGHAVDAIDELEAAAEGAPS